MPKNQIIGREEEIEILKDLYKSKEAEFLAIYGRRRVGKTYLIREYFSKKTCCYFEITGQKDGNLQQQLENFIQIFSKLFAENLPIQTPKSWREALELLTIQIEKVSKSQNVVIFFDELPWLASKKSGLMQAIDYYWNRFWNQFSNVVFIVCGSAASWMLDNLINAKGGLHNRLTKTILLKPYNLKGAQQFLSYRGISLKPKQVLDLYMVFGGIPYYLKQVEKGKSAIQNINKICFQENGLLFNEFDRLFQSLFANAETSLLIIREIAKKQNGISRNELIKQTHISSGGTLNKRLKELESAGFIQAYVPFGRKIKDHHYRVIDEYCYFYLNWIEISKKRGLGFGKEYWLTKSKTQAAISWAGYAFEKVCFKHIDQIRRALGLQAISCEVGSWRKIGSKSTKTEGSQIDLLFDREDGIVTLCEIKYSEKRFVLEKTEAKKIAHRITLFEENLAPNKQILFALVTTIGLKPNVWSEDLIQNVVTLDDLLEF